MEKKEKKTKWIKVTIFSIILLLIVWIIIILLNHSSNFKPTLQSDLNTLEKVLTYHNIELIKKNEPADAETLDFDLYLYVKFPYPTYDDTKVYDTYYRNVIGMLATVLEYRSFEILDDDKGLKIDVHCNQTSQEISQILINGDVNYFDKLSANVAVKNIKEESTITASLQSAILQQCVQKNWIFKNINLGASDSQVDQYNIYFNKGIMVREVASSIFNMVLTEKYTEKVLNNLTTTTSLDQVITTLGEPLFGNKESRLIGYKTKDLYVFFTGQQISCYPVQSFDTKTFASYVSEYQTTQDANILMEKIKKLWPDYNTYDLLGSNGFVLEYALKGIKIQWNQTERNGITLYRNFQGNVSNDISYEDIKTGKKSLPNGVYVENENLLYQSEMTRSQSIINADNSYARYQFQYNDIKGKIPDQVEDTTKNDYKRRSNQFYAPRVGNQAYVLSIENKYPAFQIASVQSTMWLDDTHLAYSVEGGGIYIYNAITRENKQLKQEEEGESLVIQTYENGILTYDNGKEIKCSI